MSFGGASTATLKDMAGSCLRDLSDGKLDPQGQQYAGTVLAEYIYRLENALNALTKK